MRALSSMVLAGVVGLGGLILAPGTASADGYGGWRGRNYYRNYVPAPRYHYGPQTFYAPPPVYYRPPPPVFYRPLPPPAYYGAPGYGAPGFYGTPGVYGGPPVSYGIRPGPGVGVFLR